MLYDSGRVARDARKYWNFETLFRYFYSSSEFELESSSSWFSPLSAKVGGSDCGGAEVPFNASPGKETGNIALMSRSDLTSLEYFSDFSVLVSVTIVDIFCIFGSVSVLASWIVPAVLFKIMPSG
ncbi:MAG: hypothetical protein WBL68_17825 [Nitrososphaeraceae archaeon]